MSSADEELMQALLTLHGEQQIPVVPPPRMRVGR